MIESKFKAIQDFCKENSDPEIVKKYSKYFKDGFDGYGIEKNSFENQRDAWIKEWSKDMSLDTYLELGDLIFKNGRFEEKSFMIGFIHSQSEFYTADTFNRIGNWFDYGVDNWGITDGLCAIVLPLFLIDNIINFNDLKSWNNSESQWKRRAVPVTLVELTKRDLNPEDAINMIESLMMDDSEYVQKGIGTLLRGLWKKYPNEIEDFLLKWKDKCGRLIVQYATEKMDKEYRKKFRKSK